ncbi:MAG: MBL fold metallo-hydrolase, partial [Clostridia bacterium]|nr:MBL fold metallo-hydrolase [Clostridia bacterium]
MKITNDIKYVGVNDHKIDLFEGQYEVPNGMAYNSYVILDEKIAVMDTVDNDFKDEWIANIKDVLEDKIPDYLVVHHMEPDHSSNIAEFVKVYPDVKIVSSQKAFSIMKNYFKTDFAERQVVVGDGQELSLGKHTLTFYTAPMVHWP